MEPERRRGEAAATPRAGAWGSDREGVTMDPVVLGVVGAVVAVMALAVVGVGRTRAWRQERRARFAGMGFQPGWPAEMPLLPRIRALMRIDDEDAPEVWHRTGEDWTLILLQFPDKLGPTVAVRSPRLALPRLSMFPRVDQEGRLADLANRTMETLFERVGGQVSFSSPAGFVRRYMVGGPDEAALREFFTEERRRLLGETRLWSLEGEGDLFVLEEVPLGKGAPAEDARVRDAMAALRILGD